MVPKTFLFLLDLCFFMLNSSDCHNSETYLLENAIRHNNNYNFEMNGELLPKSLKTYNESWQLKTMKVFSKKLLKNIASKNEYYKQEVNECFQQLSKYTRLIVFVNKVKAQSSSGDDEVKNSKSLSSLRSVAFILHKELNVYLLVLINLLF